MSEQLDIEYKFNEKKCLKYIPHKLLLGGGPPNCSPRVLFALSQPPLSTLCKELFQLMDEIQEMLKFIFQTKNIITFGMQATGTGAIEAVFINLLKPGDKVLVPVIGKLGRRVAETARRAQLEVTEIFKEAGEVFTLDEIEEEIIKYKPVLLFVVHGESSIGILQPIEGVGEICQKYNCLFAVDAIASLGCVPFFTDRWKIDVALATSNKAMRGPSGLSYLTFNQKAFKKINPSQVPSMYFDLTSLAKMWNCFDDRLIYHYTFDAHYLFAARESMAEIIEEGLEKAWNNYKINCKKLHEGMKAIGCIPFIKNPNFLLPMINSFHLPKGVNVYQLIKYASDKYHVEFSMGLDIEKYTEVSKCLRIGLMGYNCRSELVDFVLKIVEDSCKHFSLINQSVSKNGF